ncbi:SUKH-4 family immunity protein [Kitasatospora sp. KL5]|uniref:SUKH-4 family immunity protein n=1 Tax=Kitasatospora sp. KL5 TaxID=3425125 RepID=UPI003D6E0B44
MTNDDSPRAVSVVVDCAGQSLESAVVAAGRAAGEAGPGVHLRLERVELAGPLVSSDEPKRIMSCGSRAVSELVGRPVTIVPPADADDRSEVAARHDLPGALDELLWLTAAAALELPGSGLQVWRAFAAALTGRPVSVEQLTEFAARRPEITVEGRTVRFADLVAHRAVRARLPLSDAQQRAVHRALVGLRSDAAGTDGTDGTVAAYLGAARPVHAALAGELEDWLEDPGFLVESGWYGLGLGLALMYPQGVPLGGVAGDLHCLLLEGLAASASHEEWLSWVHHTLVSRGMAAVADEVVARARLPWRTLWSRWQWPSGYAPRLPQEIEQDELCLVHGPDGPTLATRHEPWGDESGTVFEQLWSARTGELLGAANTAPHDKVVARAEDLTGLTAGHVNGEWASSRRNLPALGLPWMGESVQHAVLCTPLGAAGGTLWVFMGRCGLFGALVHDDLVAELPQVSRGLSGHGLTPRAQWPVPDVSLTGVLTRAELEQDWAFGADACQPVAPELLPAAMAHPGTREFLTEVGWPVTEDPVLSTVELAAGGLQPADDRPHLLVGLGDLWGSPILLDGRSGEVFCEGRDHELALVAGGLPQLFRIVLLHRAALSVPVLLGVYDSTDLEEDVARWIRIVDSAAAEGGFWEHKYFNPTLLDLWEGWLE